MKRFFKKFLPKKPSPASIHGLGPASLTSALITTDLMPSIPGTASDATESAQVIAGVSVSVQLSPSNLLGDLLLSADRS